MTPCLGEHLEGFALGELRGPEADAVASHLRLCEACTREVAWLRAESRLARERARAISPAPVRMARLKRGLEARLPEVQRRARVRRSFAGALRVGASLGFAALLAFVVAHARLPASGHPEWVGSSCVSVDVPEVCPGPTTVGDLIAAVESSYDACLLATPRSLPGVSDLCL